MNNIESLVYERYQLNVEFIDVIYTFQRANCKYSYFLVYNKDLCKYIVCIGDTSYLTLHEVDEILDFYVKFSGSGYCEIVEKLSRVKKLQDLL